MVLTLYMTPASPPVRGVLLVIAALGLEVNQKLVNTMAGEHLTEEYLKMNPQHTVPMLQDDNFVVWDSHAISGYLVTAYGKDDSLYPKDPKQKALIDQRLHFDSGILFPRLIAIAMPVFKGLTKSIDQNKLDAVEEAYGFLDKFLDGPKYLVDDSITIADLSLGSTVTTLNEIHPIDANKFPNVFDWKKRLGEIPYFEKTNGPGLEMFSGFFRSKLQ